MYIRRIEIENLGPLNKVDYSFVFEHGRPRPLILVGPNGSGKTHIISEIVNTFIALQYKAFGTNDPQLYKALAPVLANKMYYKVRIHYDTFSNISFVLKNIDFKNHIAPSDSLESNFLNKLTRARTELVMHDSEHENLEYVYNAQVFLYFPSYRLEHAGWRIEEHNRISINTNFKTTHTTPRTLHANTMTSKNLEWLMELIVDYSLEVSQNQNKSEYIFKLINALLSLIIQKPVIFSLNNRHNRSICIKNDDGSNTEWLSDVRYLSTGYSMLLQLCLSIIRDHELAIGTIKDLHDIKGIVVIDEIEKHLHSSLQYDVLPTLLTYFPNIQFIITSHSPMFLLGIKDKNIQADIFSVPDNNTISPIDYIDTRNEVFVKLRNIAMNNIIETLEMHMETKPLVLFEGFTDVCYIQCAAKFLNKTSLLDRIHISHARGESGLTKIYDLYEKYNTIQAYKKMKILFVYDCDTNQIVKRNEYKTIWTIPRKKHLVQKGIENLFNGKTISKIKAEFTTDVFEINNYGQYVKIKKDYKKRICEWLCQYGDSDDFQCFKDIFDEISTFLDI